MSEEKGVMRAVRLGFWKHRPDLLKKLTGTRDFLVEIGRAKMHAIGYSLGDRVGLAGEMAAFAQRSMGAFFSLYDYQMALKAYRRANRINPENREGWYGLGQLLFRAGKLKQAESAFHRIEKLDQSPQWREQLVVWYGKLGNCYRFRGDLGAAENAFLKLLKICEALEYQSWIAAAYTNLGTVYLMDGDLDQAESAYKNGLAIHERVGDQREMVAETLTNLGNVEANRGDLEQAKQMYERSLAIYEALGDERGIATNHLNLGIVFLVRGDLERAEAMCRTSLIIQEGLGDKENIAKSCAALGAVYGNGKVAQSMFQKSLALHAEIGATFLMRKVSAIMAL